MGRFGVKYRFGLVLLLAIVVRLGGMVAFAPMLDFTLPGNAIHGSEAYDDYAQNLIETGMYGRTPLDGSGEIVPDAAVPPLYSYALAVIYGLFGRGFVQVALFHIVLDAISRCRADLAIDVQGAHRLWPSTSSSTLPATLPSTLPSTLIFKQLINKY